VVVSPVRRDGQAWFLHFPVCVSLISASFPLVELIPSQHFTVHPNAKNENPPKEPVARSKRSRLKGNVVVTRKRELESEIQKLDDLNRENA
jgi:hypothetical protein